MVVANRNFTTTGQVGDGREAAAVDYVLQNAKDGDIDDVIATIDKFAYEKSILINVGDEKGQFLDAAVRRADPKLALELGTYCGYGSLRMARAAPNAKVYSVELAETNAVNARQIWAHAGVADRVTCVVGTIGDGGRTLDALANEHGFSSGALDFVFLDHDKNAYLNDLKSILDRGWLHPGSIVVADNVRVPGAPKYRAYMREQQGKLWNTVEHKAHLEYQSLVSDLVLESDYRG
jgi:catechol O-methyltransferase